MRYLILAAVTIVCGLVVHWRGDALPAVVRDIAGDALWAGMMVWLIAAIRPPRRLFWRGAAAFAVCCAVECSQLLHFAWLDAIRRTTVGHLTLGTGFDPRDFLAYALGVLGAVMVDRATR